jgi:hypothetical protein
VVRQNDAGADVVRRPEPGSAVLASWAAERNLVVRDDAHDTPADAGWYRQQTKAIGTITPSGNVVVERVTTAILQDFPEVSGHFSRIPVFGSSDAYKDDYDWDGMLGAAGCCRTPMST